MSCQQHHLLSALGGFLLLGLAACQVSSAAAPAATPAAPTPTAGPTPTGAPTMDAPPAPAPSAATPSAAASAPAPAPAAAASPPALVLAPPPTGAPADEREKLVLRLLQTPDASKLDERASDANLEQEPDREAHILSRMRPEPRMIHAPKVRMGDFTVSAGLPNEIVKRIFRQNLGRVRLCYEKQLEKRPKLEGKLQFDFTITPEGDVASPRAAALTLNEPALFDCIAKSTTDITFPLPEGGAPITVSVPISFAP